MNDTPKDDLLKSNKPDEDDDEPIIDLVDEIIDPNLQKDPSQLPSELWDLDAMIEEVDADVTDLPDLGELGGLEFEKAHELAADSASPNAVSVAESPPPSDDDLQWLFEQKEDVLLAESGEAPGSSVNDVAEVLDLNEEFIEDTDLLEALPDSNGIDAKAEADAEEDIDTLEIIEIEDEEIDDEIIWFDDSTEDAPSPGTEAEISRSEALATEEDDSFLWDEIAADSFETQPQSGPPRSEDKPAVTGLAEDIAPAAAAGLAGMGAAAASSAIDSTPFPETLTPADQPAGPSPEAIEAALERVIERKFGSAMQSLIHQAIEKAVSREIERLKHLLLEDEPSDRT